MSVRSHPVWGFVRALGDRQLMPTAVRVAAVVGTLLFAINHGSAVMRGKMTRDRWISGILTYLVPYCVNIHGQYSIRRQLCQTSAACEGMEEKE